MCYLIAKKFNDAGCLALQTAHGQHLADFKEKLMEAKHMRSSGKKVELLPKCEK